MMAATGVVVTATFVLIGLWHVRMAFGSGTGASAAVPSVGGKPLFVPGRKATLAVAVALFAAAALVAAAAGWLQVGVPPWLLALACDALALGLLARAVGDFRYVGFSKRVRGSPFARMDSLVYSPLCLLLAAGVALVAHFPPA